MQPTFPSKVDSWVAGVLVLSIIVNLVAIGGVAIASKQYATISAALILPIFLRLVAWPIRYVFEGEELVIRSGLIKMRVPYRAIQSVEPTRSPLSSPAFSLDRLAIKHERGSVMVSPNDKPAFLSELRKRANLQASGERLTH